ncbi:hypothetical protein HAX44_00265 [Enterococcus faecalis]|uniref:WxL domain-containing protein n=1 Tax=Enterococcus faecalis TaxID=1351 RepID=UPI0018846E8F|nr:WxL domain-containing protein [Enterococcus faecalis]MBF0004031.1 hypothetical protein [Enterococcus faecalis]MBF0006714.1 hypothetical protein [Enterococcus faecalis]
MNKYKLGSLIFMISIAGLPAVCSASEKEYNDSYIYNNVLDKTSNNVKLDKLYNLYSVKSVNQLISTIKLSDKQQAVVESIAIFIDNTSFEKVIDVFSDSLYADVPVNDKFQGQKYEITDLKDTYENKIKKERYQYATLIVSSNSLESYDQETVKQQLILLSYLIRWGNFSNGKHMFWNEIYNTQSNLMTKEEVNQLNQSFIELFLENPTQNLASKNVNNTFATALKTVGINNSYKQFVEQFLIKNGITDYSSWFYDTFKGEVYKDHYEDTNYDVGVWNRSKVFTNFLPYLLNQTNNTNLIIGETRGEIIFLSPYNYSNDHDQAEIVLKRAMKTVTNILELYDRTIENQELINIDKTLGQRAILDQGRNWLNPDDSLSYELYRVAGYTGSHPNNGAIAGAGQIQMQATRLESQGTLAHELAHELNDLFRADNEFYSTYTSNIGRQMGAYLNTFGDNELVIKDADTVANKSTLQMKTKADMVTYTKNVEDMAYVLDTLVGIKVLELPLEEQIKYIKVALVNGETGNLITTTPDISNVQTRDISIDELKQMNLKTIDDLIDNNIVIMKPGDTNKNILLNHGQGYGTTLNYSAFFLVNGKDYHHNHRIINTLLAEDGWEAFRLFNDTYKNSIKIHTNDGINLEELADIGSLEALRAVYKDDTMTYRQLMKNRYAEVMKNLKENGLLNQSYNQVLNDFSKAELEDFYKYKLQMMKKYLNLTDDFSKSVFSIDNDVYKSVGSYTDLYESIIENSYANISLNKSFKVDGKYADKELPEFNGILDGNGFTISKSNHPLFTSLKDSEVKNILLVESNIIDTEHSRIGGIANSSEGANLKNVHVLNSKINTESKEKVVSGGVIGQSTNTQIINCSVQDTQVSGTYVGGITGVANSSKIANTYTTGEVKNVSTGDLRIGGLIGNGYNKTEVNNSYTRMRVTQGNGMLGSDYSSGNKQIRFVNSVSLAEITNTNKSKYYNYSVSASPWENNFEITEYAGKSSEPIVNLDIKSINRNQVNQEFFKKDIKWGEEAIWGIEKDTSENQLPYLKNSDPRNKQEEDLSSLTLTTDYKEVYVGDSIELIDFIEEVRSKEGKEVDKKEVDIVGSVDTSKPGETIIVYKYNNIEKELKVVVKEKQASINVHDSIIYVGDSWKAEDNFDGATDKEGREVPFEKVEVSGDKIDTDIVGRYEVIYRYEEIESKAIITVKEKRTDFSKQTTITFLEDKDTGNIIDPDNPENGVEPVDPVNPYGAELMISYASNLNFGTHKAKTATSFNALADNVWANEEHTITRKVTPFVAIKDTRGANRKGWVLTAKQDGEFEGENKQPLKGAEISLSNFEYPELVGAPVVNSNEVVLNHEAKELAKADNQQGIGSWTLKLGALDKAIAQGEENEMYQTTSGVKLSIPANSQIDTQMYSTSVTWELAVDPTL